jgi:hypothetical protein
MEGKGDGKSRIRELRKSLRSLLLPLCTLLEERGKDRSCQCFFYLILLKLFREDAVDFLMFTPEQSIPDDACMRICFIDEASFFVLSRRITRNTAPFHSIASSQALNTLSTSRAIQP